MADKKIELDKLKVQSFVTSFSKNKSQTVKGGGIRDGSDQNVCSFDDVCTLDCPDPYTQGEDLCVCEDFDSGPYYSDGTCQ